MNDINRIFEVVGGNMKLQKILLLTSVIVLMMLIMVNLGISQVKKEQRISFNGSIDSIPKDQKFIVVNEVRIFILPFTQIVDVKGRTLGIEDLKIGRFLKVEGLKNPDGIFAAKITLLRKLKTKP